MPDLFPCYMVRQESEDKVGASVEQISIADLPAGDVVIHVAYSSLNYKDALAAGGHRGIVKRLPHVPGIDAAGTVYSSSSERFVPGDEVLVTGYELGSGHWGGYAEFIRVPADWVVTLPKGLNLAECMIYGTAGFTAGQALHAVMSRGIEPHRGEVLVTGSSGGVGSFAVALLAKAGYQVVAITGKSSAHPYLKRLGASRVLPREEVQDESNQPLLSMRWSAAVDTVGGNVLATVLRSTGHRGCVAACGLVGGADIRLTVYPFILRGVDLVGIDSAMCPMPERLDVWSKLAGDWKIKGLTEMAETIRLDGLDEKVSQILAGKVTGRILVEH